jgi:tyrosinase
VRYNIYEMPQDARQSYFDALGKLKRMGVYDYFVKAHLQVSANRQMGRMETDAHNSPAFAVWHRMFLDVYERSLMACDMKVGFGAPYWRTEFELGAPDRCMWSSDMFGNRNGKVTTGFMATWKGYGDQHPRGHESITRRPPRTLYEIGGLIDRWNRARTQTPFPTFETFRYFVENVHNYGHVNIGGDMNTMASPNDPLFWLVHMRTEKQFTEWQQDPLCNERYSYYGTNSMGVAANIEDRLSPWDVPVRAWMTPSSNTTYNEGCTTAKCRECSHRQIVGQAINLS